MRTSPPAAPLLFAASTSRPASSATAAPESNSPERPRNRRRAAFGLVMAKNDDMTTSMVVLRVVTRHSMRRVVRAFPEREDDLHHPMRATEKGQITMARIVKRTATEPTRFVIDGKEQWLCKCGLSNNQ